MTLTLGHVARIASLHRSGQRTLATAACALVAACGEPPPVGVGVVLDSAGVRGATIAMQHINANGGALGRQIKLHDVGGAGSTKARVAIETAELLAANPEVVAIVGHTNSNASLAASQVYNRQHVVQIAPTSSSPLYSSAGPYSFRLVGSDLHQGRYLAAQVLARGAKLRTAVMYVNDDYGRPLHQVIVEQLRAAGVPVVYDSPYSDGIELPGHADMVAGLARARPDILVWVGRTPEFILVRELLNRAVPNLPVLASDGFSGSALDRDTLRLLDGVAYVRVLNGRRKSAALEQFRAEYTQKYSGVPNDQALLAYDCVMLVAEAIRHVGPKRDDIRDWLARVGREDAQYEGLSGPIAFTKEGDRLPTYFLDTLRRSVRLAGTRSDE